MRKHPAGRKKPSLVSRGYLVWYLSMRSTWLYAGAIVSVVSLVLLVFRLKYSGPPLELLVPSLVMGLLGTANALRRSKAELDETKVKPEPMRAGDFEAFLKAVQLPEELREADYALMVGGLAKDIIDRVPFTAASAVSTPLNRALWDLSAEPSFSFRVKVPDECRYWLLGWRKTWRMPAMSRALLYPVIRALSGRSIANAGKIRLRADLQPSRLFEPLEIERTDYLSDVTTGQLTGVRFRDQQGGDFYDGLSLPFEHKDGKWTLKTCRASACANQLGVSSLVVAVSPRAGEDRSALKGYVFMVVGGPASLQSDGLLAPSGSGSLDWSDYTDFGNRLIGAGMTRELLEETVEGDWTKLVNRGKPRVLLTGYGRMLHRGGKPEFYGLVVMPRSRDEFGIDRTEKNLVARFDSIEIDPLSASALKSELGRYAKANAQRISHPLFVCIRLAERYLSERPDQFNAVLNDVAKNW